MAASMNPKVTLSCEDFQEFEEHMCKMRKIDDRIIYALNTSIPTDSFKGQVNATNQCKQLWEELRKTHSEREGLIKHCIHTVSTSVNDLRAKRDQDGDNVEITKTLRKEQTKLRLMQNELGVEEVVRDNTLKVFYERCRAAYKPPDAPNP